MVYSETTILINSNVVPHSLSDQPEKKNQQTKHFNTEE